MKRYTDQLHKGKSVRMSAAGMALLAGMLLMFEPALAEDAPTQETVTEEAAGEETIKEETVEAGTEKEEPVKEKTAKEEPAKEETTKEETVYVIAGASGEQERVIVSDWLKNTGEEGQITDESILTDIENLKGDEAWDEKEDGTISWDAAGHDIFYEGTTDEQLPVTVHVTYTLDGEEMAPEEMEGKSGEVSVRYTFENHTGQEIELDGEKSTFHVPFAAVTAVWLNESSLQDVQVTNGRVVSDGEHEIAVGIAFPGIAEDLKSPAYASLTKLTNADVPDYMEITGHAENFTWGTVYTVVTNELMSGSESDLASVADDVFGKLESLKSGVGKIADGVSTLSEGTGDLKTGADELAKGLSDLTERNEALMDGADQIVESILETIQDQLAQAGVSAEKLTLDNYTSVLGTLEKLAVGDSKKNLEEIMKKLDDLKAFHDGLSSYTEGVAQAKDGADQVSAGAGSVQGGTAKLLLGTGVLRASLPDLGGVREAVKETAELGEEYKTFTGLAEGMDGKVRFIWKISGIG